MTQEFDQKYVLCVNCPYTFFQLLCNDKNDFFIITIIIIIIIIIIICQLTVKNN